jgi:hypothetical protein
MTSHDTFMTIFTVIGVCHLALAYRTWRRRAQWDADRARWKGFLGRFSGQAEVNFLLAAGVFFLGLAFLVA